MYSSYNSLYTSFLYHSGVKGMKWGELTSMTYKYKNGGKN